MSWSSGRSSGAGSLCRDFRRRRSDRPIARVRCDARTSVLADRFTCVLLASTGVRPGELVDIASRVASRGIQVAVQLDGRRASHAPSRPCARDRISCGSLGKTTRGRGNSWGWPISSSAVREVRLLRFGLSMGCPLILYNPVPGQEVYNVDFLVNAARRCSHAMRKTSPRSSRFLSTHPERLRQMAVESAGLGRADAAQTVCERVLARQSGGLRIDGVLRSRFLAALSAGVPVRSVAAETRSSESSRRPPVTIEPQRAAVAFYVATGKTRQRLGGSSRRPPSI